MQCTEIFSCIWSPILPYAGLEVLQYCQSALHFFVLIFLYYKSYFP